MLIAMPANPGGRRFGITDCPYEARIIRTLEELRGELLRLGASLDWVATALDFRIDAERALATLRILDMVAPSPGCGVRRVWTMNIEPVLGIVGRNLSRLPADPAELRDVRATSHALAERLEAFLSVWKVRPLCDVSHRDADRRASTPLPPLRPDARALKGLPNGVLDLEAFRRNHKDPKAPQK
jgi:hypothetical protein